MRSVVVFPLTLKVLPVPTHFTDTNFDRMKVALPPTHSRWSRACMFEQSQSG